MLTQTADDKRDEEPGSWGLDDLPYVPQRTQAEEDDEYHCRRHRRFVSFLSSSHRPATFGRIPPLFRSFLAVRSEGGGGLGSHDLAAFSFSA